MSEEIDVTERDAMPKPTPLPDGPFVWILTLGPDASYEATAENCRSVTDALPPDVRERARWILLAHGYTLQILDDADLLDIGLQRIDVAQP